MPTYAYACKQCGHRFDAVQSFADPALTTCPECEGPLRKEYGSIGVTFNGSGFYRTDSRSGGESKSGESKKSESAPASSGGESSGSSTSSKSEAKASPASSGS
ncbi:putative FmdB family regulatory protein [Microbacterium sp. SLBN-154]|uniref:FmdB family zinc ribbon protein n=1 Tax=Microbacterium sp. SLBN-154 TaxID=2768458 RepID=UPI00114F86AC|nr:FmdB family zinc ribbon protein [Microbacterium sp. SLBN-154]TQK20128.1 putative FmdB family regulatory protein [Microbacterium sp. SLBN-154]